MFTIAGFTHKGTERDYNQDSILINEHLNPDFIFLEEEKEAVCFVADGVGGSNDGKFASNFILKKILEYKKDFTRAPKQTLKMINKLLIENTRNKISLQGSSTTISGVILQNNNINILHAGDSAVWLLRNKKLIKLTNDQVLSPTEINSPITSYMGGIKDYLEFDEIELIKNLPKDILMICSDGLFKALKWKQVLSILTSDKNLETKTKRILDTANQLGTPDNISVILIENL